MSDDVLLTDLCSICHVNTIKYTCPRCGVHTCSLPCVKKHKVWAQCSGIRDPAEYRKRSELATESSIDKDFNFISGVERSLDRADSIVQDRGLVLAPARFIHPNAHKPKHEIEIEERRVTVQRAPKGLSRSKQNKTHWANQHKCIMWTIEWICPDGQKIIGQGLETRKIGDAFINAVGKKTIARKRKRTVPNITNQATGQLPKGTATAEGNEPTRQVPILTADETEDGSPRDRILPNNNGIHPEQVTTRQQSNDDLLDDLYFYLHRPNTMANMKCLVPLERSSTLQDVLPTRTVLEFPTIYVRNEAPETLSKPYITESEYLERHGKDIPINIVAPTEDGEIIEREQPLPSMAVDEKKVIEMLAKDLNG